MKFSTIGQGIAVIGLALIAGLCGCNTTPSAGPSLNLPAKGSVEQTANINPKSVVGYVGDVMPYYCDGEMNVYYLQDERTGGHIGFHPFALMTTKDYINYHDYGMVIPYVNSIYDQDLALGTGSVIKASDGTYHCFYTGHNDRSSSGLPYYEMIQHAVSTDKINWTKIPEDGFYGNKNDFRDPYVYYSEEDSCYYMLITTNLVNKGIIKQYKSTDLKKWTDNGTFFTNDSGNYNMECPTFIHYNGYYYLSYSEQGDFRVTHYRYKKNLSDPWIKPEVDYFDGIGLYAGRMEADDKNLYMFGWCGTKSTDWSGFGWGGNLVTHQLVQHEDGTLTPTMVSTYKSTFKTEVGYKLDDGSYCKELSFKDNEQKAYKVEAFGENVTRISLTLNSKYQKGDCGLTFNTTANDTLGMCTLAFNFRKRSVEYYNNVSGFGNMGTAQVTVPYSFATGKDIPVDIVIDGQIITVYVDDTIALTTRILDMPGNEFSFYGNQCSAAIKEISFYE